MSERDLEAGNHDPSYGRSTMPQTNHTVVMAERMPTKEVWKQDPKREQAPVPIKKTTFFQQHGRTELEVFQTLVGIHFLAYGGPDLKGSARTEKPASVFEDIFIPSRAAASRHRNRGLYDRCISTDMKMRSMYAISHYLISFLYLLQILVAATLTAISASPEVGTAPVTVLGAINTVLAGILAWLNGQGMPQRYRRARDNFREVVKAIEAAERMFAEIDFIDWPEGGRPTPIGERDRLEKMYEDAKKDMEGNYPDTQQDPSANQAQEKLREVEAEAGKTQAEVASVKAEAWRRMEEFKEEAERRARKLIDEAREETQRKAELLEKSQATMRMLSERLRASEGKSGRAAEVEEEKE